MAKRLQRKERLTSRLVSVLVFLITFNLLAIPLYISIYTDFSFEPLREFNAKVVSSTLNILGYNTFQEGSKVNLVTNDIQKEIDISWDSTGWKSMYAIAALIIATPVRNFSRKIKSALVGIGIIFFVNYLRITSTIMIAANFGFNWFDIVHTVLWREGLILAVVGLWVLWMRMEKYKIWKIK